MALLGAVVSLGLLGPAAASTPPLVWKNLQQVVVHCRLSGGATDPDLLTRVCGEVRAAAAPDAPAPVRVVSFGDPLLADPRAAAILADFAVQRSPENRGLLVFTVRVQRPGGEDAPLFGSAPQALSLDRGGPDELRPALNEALAEILPWRGRDPRFRLKPLPR